MTKSCDHPLPQMLTAIRRALLSYSQPPIGVGGNCVQMFRRLLLPTRLRTLRAPNKNPV